jgi:signal transduction histidine kinase
MKLLTAATRTNLRATVLISALGGVLFYVGVRQRIYEEVDEELRADQLKAQTWIRRHNRLPSRDNQAFVNHLTVSTGRAADPAETWRDSTLYEPSSGEDQPYRLLTFPVTVNNQMARITLGKPLVESDELIFTILVASALLGTALLISFAFINRHQSKRLLAPFHAILERLEAYQLRSDQPLLIEQDGGIDEFNQLNQAIFRLTQRTLGDFRSVKEFTANASHELQTPLAIIQSKLELSLQTEQIPPSLLHTLVTIQQSVFRLSRLNQTLLLLAKIEHGQYNTSRERVDLEPLITERLASLLDWTQHRDIVVNTDLSAATMLIHPELADILIANLLGNAVKHNVDHGQLIVTLQPYRLQIDNTGHSLGIEPERLFDRFYKAGNVPNSLGLGLAIVREIGDQHNLTITYAYQTPWHRLTVTWPH